MKATSLRWLLPLALAMLLAACRPDDPEDYRSLELSGIIDTTVALDDLSEVIVGSDLVFAAADTGLVISGRVLFTVADGATITLPRLCIAAPGSRVAFRAQDATWEGLVLPDSSTFRAADLDINGAIRGLDLGVGSTTYISRGTFNAGFYGIQATQVDSLTIESLDMTDYETGVSCELGSTVAIRSGRIRTCTTGVKNVQSTLLLQNTTISDCAFAGLWTHLEDLTEVRHCRFSANTTHLYVQNNRNMIVRDNDFDAIPTEEFPIRVVFSGEDRNDFANNNIGANSLRRFINIYQGILHAENNWWNTADTTAIAYGIYDGRDEVNRTSIVHFYPSLNARVTGTGPQ